MPYHEYGLVVRSSYHQDLLTLDTLVRFPPIMSSVMFFGLILSVLTTTGTEIGLQQAG